MNASRTTLFTPPTRPLSIATVLVLALAGAAPPTAMSSSMTVSCGHRYVSQADAAQLFGTRNAGHAYAQRQRLYTRLARACAGNRSGTYLLLGHDSGDRPLARRR